MFLHIQTFDKQFSVQAVEAKDAVPAKLADTEHNIPAQEAIPAKPAEPLINAINAAMAFWKKTDTGLVAFNEAGKQLDVNKTPEQNGLKDNDFVRVTSQQKLDEEKKARDEAAKL